MKKQSKKKTGRPKSTGAGDPMVVRMHKPQLKDLDAWIGNSGISRPEAIRQLVNWALGKITKKPEQPSASDPPMTLLRRARIDEMRRL